MKRIFFALSVLALAACQSDSANLLGPDESSLQLQPSFSVTDLGAGMFYYSTRAEFEAAAPLALTSEDFEDGLVADGVDQACGFGPLNAASVNACFNAGGIAAGVTFSGVADIGGATDGEFSLYGAGFPNSIFPGTPSADSRILVGATFGYSTFRMDFVPAVQFVGLDVIQPAAPPIFPPNSHLCTVRVYGASYVTPLYEVSNYACAPTGSFFGFASSDTPITRVEIQGPPAQFVPGADNLAFAGVVADTDGDGVLDEFDAFVNSNLAEYVYFGECTTDVANHLFENGATFMDLIGVATASAKNHGQFVSAVTQLANDWKKAGLISGQEKGKITSCAAKG